MTSLEWWRSRSAEGSSARAAPGPAPLDLAGGERVPTLDEAWLWYLVDRERRGQPLPPSLEAMCVYAEDVRQGRWLERVAPEQALQSLYLALAQDALVGAKSPERFEAEARALFEAVVAQLASGGTLLDAPFLARVPALQKYVEALKEDHRLFQEDLLRSERHEVTLPAVASLSGGARSVSMLVLDRPVSTQFKLWARKHSDCALLLVRQADGTLVLSADPSKKLKLGWLAAHLSKRDRDAWYDGARHEGTLIASPKGGAALDLRDVVAVLSTVARVSRRRPVAAVGVLAGVALLVTSLLLAQPRRPDAAEAPGEAVAVAGAKGDPISAPQVIDLLAAADGPKSYQAYALVAGVCGYTGEHELHAPCRDARAVRDLLVKRLGYRRENVLFLVDRPEAGEATDGAPTAAGLKLAVERFRARYAADETSSFLFYYSGHGGYEKGARKDFGVLQPSGYFENEALPMSDRGWDMQELLDDLRKGVPSKHVMVVLDACYSGWAVGAKGDERLSPELRTLWRERAEVVLTAGTKGQRAWEDEAEEKAWQWGGHSALTAWLLAGLGEGGRAKADANGDRVVTDEELARYLRERVPQAVRASRRAEQTPQFFRFDEQLPKSGQFLFIPEP